MQLQTILNRVEPYKSFVFKHVSWDENASRLTLRVKLEHRANGRPICSGCRRVAPGYDRQKERNWEFVPLWQIVVLFVYRPRRVDCPRCNAVLVEHLPWAHGKSRQTISYRWFLARWGARVSWQTVAEIFHTSWETVFRAVEYAVQWGVVHRKLSDVVAIGVDEIQWKRGHNYLTLVYQIDARVRRLLWVGQERTEASLSRFFWALGDEILPTLRYVCSDMWQAYINVIRAWAPESVHVLDRYHIMARMNKALDQVRAEEARRLNQQKKKPVLKHSRWCILKRPENLTGPQTEKLADLLRRNLRTVRAYLMREDFQRFWDYRSPTWAGRFLDDWCARAMRSRIEPMKRVARSLRGHRELLLNWFRAKGEISAGIVEGLNAKAKLTMRKAYGFRTPRAIEVALYHQLGHLPEPEFTHRFC
jgi:transposase